MTTFDFELTGRTPLLMRADDVVADDELAAWRKSPENRSHSKPGDDRTPPEAWMGCVYKDCRNVVMPAANVMVAIRGGATSVVMTGRKTYREASQSDLLIQEPYLEFLSSGRQIAVGEIDALRGRRFGEMLHDVQRLGFALDVRRARIGMSRHVRVRPRFDEWLVRGRIGIVGNRIDEDTLRQFFNLAGRGGLGDWRPSSKTPGPFGQFTATLTPAE